MLPKKVVLVPIQSCRLFHKFEDMVEFTVVKILRSGLPNILILSVMSWMHLLYNYSNRHLSYKSILFNQITTEFINIINTNGEVSNSQKIKIKCTACPGWCYSKSNLRTCAWCEGPVHKKCFQETLGCIRCCESIIPGYNVHTFEFRSL